MEKLQLNRLPRLVANHKMGNSRISIGCSIKLQNGCYCYDFNVKKNGAFITFQPWQDLPDWVRPQDNVAQLSWSEKFWADSIIAHWEQKHPLPTERILV